MYKSRYNGYRSQDVSLLTSEDQHEKNRYHRRSSGIRRWPSFRSNRTCSSCWHHHDRRCWRWRWCRCWRWCCCRRWRRSWPEHRRPGCYRRSRSSCWRCCFGFELRHHPPRNQPPRSLIIAFATVPRGTVVIVHCGRPLSRPQFSCSPP